MTVFFRVIGNKTLKKRFSLVIEHVICHIKYILCAFCNFHFGGHFVFLIMGGPPEMTTVILSDINYIR